ncbi:hypothetical protein ACWC9R_02200 [Streptomyces sp. NPDC001219]
MGSGLLGIRVLRPLRGMRRTLRGIRGALIGVLRLLVRVLLSLIRLLVPLIRGLLTLLRTLVGRLLTLVGVLRRLRLLWCLRLLLGIRVRLVRIGRRRPRLGGLLWRERSLVHGYGSFHAP